MSVPDTERWTVDDFKAALQERGVFVGLGTITQIASEDWGMVLLHADQLPAGGSEDEFLQAVRLVLRRPLPPAQKERLL